VSPKTVHFVSGAIFALIALIHLWRVSLGLPATVGETPIPQWMSVVAIVVAGGLAVANFGAARGRRM
jgi:hypothetical protein